MRELKNEIWPFKVKLESDSLKEITPVEEWLGEQFGIFKGRWNVVYRYNSTDFYFKDSYDAMMFKLRWS